MDAVLFDLDGTLSDPAVGIVSCMKYAIAELSGPTWADADLKRFIGPPLECSFREIFASEDASLVARAIRLYRARFAREGLYENRLYAGIPDVLALLRGLGLRLFVATSKPTQFALRIVEHFGIRHFFENVYGSELSGERSNKAALLRHLLAEERLGASDVCMVGDRRHDIEGARANGVMALGVLWGYGTRDELVAAGAQRLVERVVDLPSTLHG